MRYSRYQMIVAFSLVSVLTLATDLVAGDAAEETADEDAEYEDEYGDEYDDEQIPDPLRHWNRVMFVVNDRVYFWVLKPASTGYAAVVPEPARVGVKNFFSNVAMPVRFVNCLLQGEPEAAVEEVAAFVVNTTVGVAGFRDAAKGILDVEKNEEDLGQTLGSYGIGQGCYIVWPLLGPSTPRDTVGLVGDYFLDPVSYVRAPASYAVGGVRTVNGTSLRIGDYEQLKESALDPYEALRDVYLQYRAQKVKEFRKPARAMVVGYSRGGRPALLGPADAARPLLALEPSFCAPTGGGRDRPPPAKGRVAGRAKDEGVRVLCIAPCPAPPAAVPEVVLPVAPAGASGGVPYVFSCRVLWARRALPDSGVISRRGAVAAREPRGIVPGILLEASRCAARSPLDDSGKAHTRLRVSSQKVLFAQPSSRFWDQMIEGVSPGTDIERPLRWKKPL